MTFKGPFQLRWFYDDSVVDTMGFKISENVVGKKVDKMGGDLTWGAESRLQYIGGGAGIFP